MHKGDSTLFNLLTLQFMAVDSNIDMDVLTKFCWNFTCMLIEIYCNYRLHFISSMTRQNGNDTTHVTVDIK